MADMGNSGMMSQSELDALIMGAGASEEPSGDGMDLGGMNTAPPPSPASKPDTGSSGAMSQADLDALMMGSGDSEESTPKAAPPAPKPKPASLGLVDLPSFAPAAAPLGQNGASGISRVSDIPLEVTVELGRTRLLIRDILDLSVGSIIELDKIAGEPVDLFANGMLVARGEVIVIDDNFGVRVTEIITAGERSAEKDSHARAA